MTRETKDGFVVRDRRFWVPDDERDQERAAAEQAAAGPAAPAAGPAAPPAPDVETLRAALADLEDSKRRLQRDADRQLELQRSQILESLLPVLDNLERSIQAAAGAGTAPGLVDGVKLVHNQFLTALGDFGLQRRSAVGQPFDPRIHDAIAVVPVAEPHRDGVVVAEAEPAYMVGERVIRPAKVMVGRAAERPVS